MAQPAVHPRLAEALSSLFGSAKGSNCDVQFCLQGADAAAGGAELGPPVPAHTFALGHTSERFQAQFERWQDAPPAETRGQEGLLQAGGKRLLLRVPLGSEVELPAALLALRFAYTGQVHASSIREALGMLRVGDYLGIEGCAAACCQWLADRLAATAAKAGSSETAEPAVLQLYACQDLWPSDDPSFVAVLSFAKVQLVRRFGSTIHALNEAVLLNQVAALPAAGMEALLESDDLGTGSEDSVLLLLAKWMKVNWARTDAATRQRLCGLVRLTQLSPQVTAIEAWRKETREAQAAAGAPGWHSNSPRKQCIPEEGIPLPFSISKEALRAELEGLRRGQHAQANASFSDGHLVAYAQGLAWSVFVQYHHGEEAAGLYLRPQISHNYAVPGSGLAAGSVPRCAFFVDADLTVNRRQEAGGLSAVSIMSYSRKAHMKLGEGLGVRAAFPLSPQLPAAPGAAAARDVLLARWAEYAHEGSAVTGTLTLLPPK
ncbi:hypothetical protein HYH03_017531 [Edaphochlamys debaryana]|uniref:BTB domain-containing protein n=1 Tax=Edaphochlamys debaryana TaxID=47281 RepID=A0A835XP23_9CHLO|nr:hypothetical protein HYH03_017531 [Edaphochlamys debaryana]|eukprot:KAG2483589.1 hypothetical protein HYH03_017531 [Edaphochlamys debaryana]